MLSIFSCAYWPSVCVLFFFFSFGHACGMWKFPGQGLKPHHSINPSHCSDNARLLTRCITRELSVCLPWRNFCLDLLPIFLLGLFLLLLNCKSCLYILQIKLLLVSLFANIFSHSVACLFFPLKSGFLCCAEACKFDQVPFVYFCFYVFCLRRLM